MTHLSLYDRYAKTVLSFSTLALCISHWAPTSAWGHYTGIDSRFEPMESVNQGSTNTCYGHSARFLLQYLVNSQPRADSAPPPSLAVLDIIGQGSDFEIPQHGTAFKLLQHLKNHSIWVNQDLDLEAVWKFNQDFLSTYLDHPEQSVSTIISQTLPSTLKVQLPHWREVLATQELTDSLIGNEFQAPYRFLNATIQAKRVKLPAYNLHVFDPNSASLRDLFPDLPRDTSKEDLLIATLRAWFTSHGSRVVPLALNFCTHTLTTASEMCDPHSINVVAMHTECATDGTCSDIFKTRNSWGTDTEGWFEAKPLARSILDAQTQITYLEPCRNADDITVSRNDTEVCAPEILGLHFGPENTVPAHLSSQKYLASHPLHYLAMSRDENQFFKQVDQLQTEGKLTPELYKTLAYGKTLGHLAVEDRALRIIQWLSANYRGLLEQNLDRVGNAAHFAVFLGHAPTIRTLMTEMPELYRTPDRQGWLPADIAADRANKPVLLELFKLQPALLTLKNSRDETPLSRLKRMHRPDYDRIRTIVKPRPWLLRAYRWLTHN